MLAIGLGVRPFLQWLFPLPYQNLIAEYSSDLEVDPLLVAAMIQVESAFRPGAISAKGALGLMQIMPETAFWLGEKLNLEVSPEKVLEPELNIYLGAFYLKYLLDGFSTESAALAAYNGGPKNVQRWLDEGIWDGSWAEIKEIPFPETRAYVQKVRKTRDFFRFLYGQELRQREEQAGNHETDRNSARSNRI